MEPDIRAQLNAGREHYVANDYQKALPLLESVASKHEGFADVHNMLGVCLQHLDRALEARDHFKQALALNPNYTAAALNLAVCYNELGQYDDAKAVYEQASAGRESRRDASNLDGFVRGKLANLHHQLGLAYEGVGMLPHAILQFRHALELCPTFVDIRTKLGTTLRDAGEIDAAIDELTGVRDAKPEYTPARLHLGITLWSAKRHEEAREEWRAVLEREPDNKRARMYLRMSGEAVP